MHLSSRCYCDVIRRYRCVLLYMSYSIYSFVISEWMAFCCYISVFHLNSCRLNRRSNARIAQPTLMHKNVRNVTSLHCSSAQPEVLLSSGNKLLCEYALSLFIRYHIFHITYVAISLIYRVQQNLRPSLLLLALLMDGLLIQDIFSAKWK
jgi:hypothetical protein